MEKREFLRGAAKLAVLAPLSAAAAADNRLFGTPASVAPIDPGLQNKLRLSFARGAMPLDAWDGMAGLVTAMHMLQTSKEARDKLGRSAKEYFASYGVNLHSNAAHSRELAMASLVTDEGAIAAAKAGDYAAFMRKVMDYKLPGLPEASGLSKRVTELLRKDATAYANVKAAVERAGAASPETIEALRRAAAGGVIPDESVSIFTESAIVVSTLAVAYTEVAAVLVAVSAAYVTVIAVVGLCHAPTCGRIPGPHGLSELDPDLVEGASVVTAAARILGNQEFEVHLAKDLLAREVEAIFTASEEVGLIAIPAAQREYALRASIETAQRAYGLTA